MARDPYAALQSPEAYGAAVTTALASEAAELVRHRLQDALVDLLEDGPPETEYMRGYRHALRVAYLLAGGLTDGSETSWAEIEGTQ